MKTFTMEGVITGTGEFHADDPLHEARRAAFYDGLTDGQSIRSRFEGVDFRLELDGFFKPCKDGRGFRWRGQGAARAFLASAANNSRVTITVEAL